MAEQEFFYERIVRFEHIQRPQEIDTVSERCEIPDMRMLVHVIGC